MHLYLISCIIVDGQWSLWSTWTTCNVTCDGGLTTRYRICTLAAYGGSDCEGDDRETLECNTHNCPVVSDMNTHVLNSF